MNRKSQLAGSADVTFRIARDKPSDSNLDNGTHRTALFGFNPVSSVAQTCPTKRIVRCVSSCVTSQNGFRRTRRRLRAYLQRKGTDAEAGEACRGPIEDSEGRCSPTRTS